MYFSHPNLFLIFQPYPALLPGDYLHVIQFYLEVTMKKMVRMSVLSGLVLAAMAVSAFSAMAMGLTHVAEPVASATGTSSLKQEVIGTVTAINATSITLNGTVYTLSANTQIQGTIRAGDTVKLEIVTNSNGSITVYEVAKPNSSGTGADISGSQSGSIDHVGTVEPIGPETTSLDKSNVVEPISTVEPIHTEVVSPDKGSSTGSSVDKNNPASTPDKSGSSLDQHGNGSGNSYSHDTNKDSSQSPSVSAPNSPADSGQ